MALDDIQLNIVVTLQGDPRIDALTRKLRGVTQASDAVTRSQDAQAGVNRRSIRSWEDLTTQLSNVERKYDALFRAGVHMTQMGHDLIGVSERIMRTGMGVVDAYADYDMMLRRGAVALNTNAEWQVKLDKAIQDTATTLGVYKPEEVAEAYYIWGAAAGVVVDTEKELAQITGVVQDVLIATAMAGGSLETNLKGVYSILSIFNMEATEGSRVAQTLALMTERTAADFGDLINAFTYIGPLAESVGVGFEDVTQILGVLADAGQRGSRAGRGLSMVIEGMAAPSGPAGEALDGLVQRTHGLSAAWEDVVFPQGEFVGMNRMIQEMAESVEGMTDAERGRFYATAFTNNATRALIPLIEEQIILNEKAAASGDEWVSVLEQEKYQLNDVAHFFEGMRGQMLGSINAITGAFRNSFFPILQMVAGRIMQMAVPIMDRVRGMAEAFGEWLKQNPEIVDMAVRIMALVAAASALAGMFFLVGGSISLVIANLGSFAQGIGRVIAPFAALALVVGGLVTMIMTNFGGIRDAIVNLASAFGEFFDALNLGDMSFMGILTELWKLVEPYIEAGVRALADALNWLADRIRDLTGNDQFMAWASDAAKWLVALVTASMGLRIVFMALGTLSGALWAFQLVWSGMSKLIGSSAVLGAFNSVKGAIGAVVGAFMRLSPFVRIAIGAFSIVGLAIGAAFLAYETNFLGFRDLVNGIIGWLQTTVPQVISTVMGFFQTVGATIVGIWTQVWTVVGPILEAFIAPFIRLAAHGIPALIAKLQEFWTTVAPIFMSIRDTVVDVFTNVVLPAWDGLIAKVQEFFNTVVPILSEFVGNIIGVAQFIIEGFFFPLIHWWDEIVTIVGIASGVLFAIVLSLLEGILAVVGPWVEAGIRIFGVLWETLTGIFGAALDVIMGIVKTVFGTINEIFRAFAKLFSGDVEGFLLGLNTAFWTAVDGILTIIGGLVSGIWTAFTGMVAIVWELVTGFLSGIVGLFPDFVQDWINVGGDVVRGLWEGITGLARWVWGRLSGFVSDIVDKVKGFFGIRSPSTVFADMGRAIVQGLWNGISALAGWLWDKVSGFVGGIVDGVMDFLGIKSPSRVFAEIGENLVKGMAVGIDHTPDAVQSMNAYAEKILDIGRATSAMGTAFSTEFQTDAGLNMESSAERFVRVELDLKSSDGSVDDLTLEQLKNALMGSDLVRALERMAEAG